MRHQTLLYLSLLALFVITPFLALTPYEGITNNKIILPNSENNQDPASSSFLPPLPAGPIYSDGQYQYEGLGTTLATQEYAQGTNHSLSVTGLDSGESQYGQMRLPAGWTGYQLDADVYNLYDQPYFMTGSRENGNFESGTTLPDQWNFISSGMGSNTTYPSEPYFGYKYGTNYGNSGTKGVRVWYECNNPWYWDDNYYIAWRNTINIPRDDPVYARLTFQARVTQLSASAGSRGRMVIYAQVAGYEHRLLLESNCPSNDVWYPLTISIPYDEVINWLVPGDIVIRLGLSWTSYQQAWEYTAWGIDFDNVALEVRGLVDPTDSSWLELNMNSTTPVAGTYGYGYGTYSVTGTWTNPTEVHKRVRALWQCFDSEARSVQFSYDLTLYITRTATTEQQVGAEGSRFVAKNDSLVYWTTWMYAYQPFYFELYNLTITRPTTETWTLHKAWDALFRDRTSFVTTTSTQFRLNNLAISEVFGWWNFTFSSLNVISSVTPIQHTYYISPRTPSQLSITVTHLKNAGQTNITLYRPDGSIAHEQSTTFSATTTVGFNVDFNSGTTYTPGRYTLCVSYDNGVTPTQTAAGFYSTQFDIIHDTSLTPEQSPLVVTYGAGFFYPRVFYNNTDRSIFIGNTSGTVTVTGSVDLHTIDFYQAGSWYEAKVSNALLTPQDYTLTVDADADFYEPAQTIITLQVRSDATLSSPESPGLTLAYDEATTVQVFYEDELGSGIAGATVTTDWPTGPTGAGNGTPGWYDITIDTSDQPSPGTYILTIQAQLNYYTTRTLKLTIVVREISTTIDYTPPGSVAWDEDVVIDFNFVVDDPDSQYDGNGLTSASITSAQLDGAPLSTPSDFTFTDLGGGQYRFIILSTSGKISTVKSYTLVLNLAPADSKYSDATRTITFTVRALETAIIYTPLLPTPFGEDVVINFTYLIDDPESTHDGEGITGVTSIAGTTLDGSALLGGQYTFVEIGSGEYTLTILYSSGRINSIKSYTLQLVVSSPSSTYQNSSRQITFAVRELIMQITFDPISTTPWGDDIIIVFYYRVSDTASSQHGSGIEGVTSIAGSTLDGTGLLGGDYTLVDNSGGQYTLTLLYSSGKLSSIKTYTLYLYVNSPDSQHDDASQSTNFTVRKLTTQITYVPVIPVPWSENVVITFYYTVNDPASSQDGTGITGVTSIAGSTLDAIALLLTDYTLAEVGGGEYTLTILYSSGKINSIKLYTLSLYVSSPDAQHNDATQSITFNVRQLRTFITYDAVSITPWAEDVVITFYYTVNDPTSSLDGTGITGVTSIAGSTLDAVALTGTDYTLVDNGGGQYTLTILYSSGKLNSIKAYTLQLHVISPDAQHEDADQTIGFTVRTLLTSISF
ncbi:MAG: hypothetical protein ACFE89_09095, partial [Candidatus Hodarchaeota archaeon]